MYPNEGEEDVDSDTPSLVLEDIKGSSDGDIFLNKNPSKRELMNKLMKVMKNKQKLKERQKNYCG